MNSTSLLSNNSNIISTDAFINARSKDNENSELQKSILDAVKSGKVSKENLKQLQSQKPPRTQTSAKTFVDTYKNEENLNKIGLVGKINISLFDDNNNTIGSVGEKLKLKPVNTGISTSNDYETAIETKNQEIVISSSEIETMELLKFDYKSLHGESDLIKNLDNLKKLSTKIEGLDKMGELIDKVKMGYSLTFSDFNAIEDMYKLISLKLSSPNSKLTSIERKALSEFTKQFEVLKGYKGILDTSIKQHNESIKKLNSSTHVLVNELKKVESELKEKGISLDMIRILIEKKNEAGVDVEDLNKLQNGELGVEEAKALLDKFQAVGISNELVQEFMKSYKEILLAGLLQTTLDNYLEVSKDAEKNPTFGFSLYRIYMEKMAKFINSEEYEKNPQGLYQIMNEYTNLFENISKIAESDLSIEQKKGKILDLASSYVGNDSQEKELLKLQLEKLFAEDFDISTGFSLVTNALSAISGDKTQSISKFGNSNKSGLEKLNNFSEKLGLIKGATSKELKTAKSLTSDSYNFIRKNKKICNFFGDLFKASKDVGFKTLNCIKAYDNYFTQMKKLQDVFKKPIFIRAALSTLSKERKETMEKMMIANQLVSESLETIIRSFLSKADYMQSKLDLTVDPEKANIMSLLEKFREIIEELDNDTARLIREKFESQLIDTTFLRNIKEHRERWSNLDKFRDQVGNIFSESKEVKESKLTFEQKELKFSQNSQKLALLTFYHAGIIN